MRVSSTSLVDRWFAPFIWLSLSLLAQSLQVALAESDEELQGLAERITAFWEARVADDPITTYEFEESNVRGIVSLRDYVRRNGAIDYNKATLKSIERVGEDEAVAMLDVEFRIHAMGGDWLNRELSSNWVLVDGEWYHKYHPFRPVGADQAANEDAN